MKEIADDLSDDQLEAAVDEIDEDGSGKIEFEGKVIDSTRISIITKRDFPKEI